MTIQEAIKRAMKGKKITQQVMADRIGTAQSNLSMQLRSGSGMRIENAMKMVNACGFDLVLVDRENSKNVYVIGEDRDVVIDESFDERVRRIIEDELSKMGTPDRRK